MRCPKCKGRGYGLVFGMTSGMDSVGCPKCLGTGEVSDSTALDITEIGYEASQRLRREAAGEDGLSPDEAAEALR